MIIPKKWVQIEMEHTKSPARARKIASDHIKEFGREYYPALLKMEHKLSLKK